MPRPEDDDYYVPNRTQHVALGDIFREIPLYRGADVTTCAMLLNYTSGMLVGAEGTNREYAHPYRLLAPIFELQHIHEHDPRWTAETIERLRQHDSYGGWMYLPGISGDFEEGAAALFRPTSFLHEEIAELRVTQLSYNASRRLCEKLGKVFAGIAAQLPVDHPDMLDHWAQASR